MKYYVVRQDNQMHDIVHVVNGPNDVNFTDICHEKAHRIQKRTLLMCETGKDVIFPDILTIPFLMFSPQLKRIVSIYQKDIPYKEIVLLEQKQCFTAMYFLPVLPVLDCVTNPFRFHEGASASRKPILDYSKCKNLSIFKFKDINSIYTVMSLELLESILVRKCIGLSFTQVEMC